MTCSSSCFSDGESLYKSIKKRGIVIREASGRVCLHSSCTLICQSGRVCTISWKWWDVIEMSHGIVKNKCVWGGVESWVTGLQESVPLIASQPIGETEWYPATLTGRGGGRTAHNFHYPCILYSSHNCFSFLGILPGAGVFLQHDSMLSWLHWKVFLLNIPN